MKQEQETVERTRETGKARRPERNNTDTENENVFAVRYPRNE